MGRLRKKPWAEDYLKDSKIVLNNFDKSKDTWNYYFGNDNPIEIEIGHGKGDFLIQKIIDNENINYVGIEKSSSVQALAIKKILSSVDERKNFLFLNIDAISLSEYFKKNTISKIYINFPDPWPKDRHFKRRLLNFDFLCLYSRLLVDGGTIEFKTDKLPLFDFSLKQINDLNFFEIIDERYDLHKSADLDIIKTEYEKKFIREEKPIYYLKLVKIKPDILSFC